MTRSIKAEQADGPTVSSPTVPNSSSRAQTIHSTTPASAAPGTPTETQASMEATTPNGDHAAIYSLGADSHNHIQVIKKLGDLGIDATLSSLPKFVIVGDQSAGKSSVVEAVCDISLPRGQGTCTRCPFLITASSQMTFTGTWQCVLSIKQPFWFDDRKSTGHFCRRDQPVTSHFATVTNKAELETMLRRAQLAVLNPRHNPQEFLNADVSYPHPLQVAFSPNIISLEIQGPGLPELSFYDLPGSIQVVEDGQDQALVNWIEKLISEYIEDEKTLVLLACGADQDVETSKTLGIIKYCKAESRTLGVLTKVDLASPLKMEYIKDIMHGRFSLGRGWFAVKLLSQEEIQNRVDAREVEAIVFGREPWNTFAPELQQRLGIPRLQEAISHSLTDHIRGELPEILARVGNRLSDISAQLLLFPDRPTHPTLTVFSEISKLASTITNHVKADADINVFRREVKGLILECKKQLANFKPTFDWKTPGWKAPALVVSSDDENLPDATPTPLPQRFADTITPTTSRKRNAEATPSSHRRVKQEPSAPAVQKTRYTLDALRAEYDCGNTSGVPGSINHKVTDRLILQALSQWDVFVERMLKDITSKILAQIQESIAQDLAGRRATRFYARTTETLTGLVNNIMRAQTDHVKYLLICEQERPVTYSKWASFKVHRQREFEGARLQQRTNEYFDAHDEGKSKSTPNDKRAEKARDITWTRANLGVDEWSIEVDCAATLITYYDMASMCFIDTVAKSVERGVMRPLREDVSRTLLEELHADDAQECALLLAEDPQREAERAKLTAEKERLEKALAELNSLHA